MKIQALHDNVVVKIDKKSTKHGSIELPQTAKALSDEYCFGTVIDVGPGREDVYMRVETGEKSKVFIKPDLSIGDRVIFQPFAATHKTVDAEGNELTIIAHYNILGLIKE